MTCFLRGKCVTGTTKYIAVVAMGYSSLSHGAKDGVLDSRKKVLSGVALTARSPAYARRIGRAESWGDNAEAT